MANPVFHSESIQEKFELREQLGQAGQYGITRTAIEKDTQKEFAVKIISKARFKRFTDNLKGNHAEDLQVEIVMMTSLNHPNVISWNSVYEDDMNMYVVMEKCTGGSLFDHIQTLKSYSEKEVSTITRQLLKAVKYLHNQRIVLCDLKPESVLFANSDEHSALKLVHFSKAVTRGQALRRLCEAPFFVAPEVLDGEYDSSSGDIWSIGVITFMLLFGFAPFNPDTNSSSNATAAQTKAIFKLIRSGFSPTTKKGRGAFFPADINVTDSAKDFIAKMLSLDAMNRVTASEALQHPFIKGESTSSEQLPASVLKSLEAFRKPSMLQDDLVALLSSALSKDHVEKLKETIMQMDKGQNSFDAKVAMEELSHFLAGEHLSKDEISDIMSSLANEQTTSGTISFFNQLIHAMVHRKCGAKEERSWAAFLKLDVNNLGRISINQMQKEMPSISDKQVNKAGVNTDNGVDYYEFLKLADPEMMALYERET